MQRVCTTVAQPMCYCVSFPKYMVGVDVPFVREDVFLDVKGFHAPNVCDVRHLSLEQGSTNLLPSVPQK